MERIMIRSAIGLLLVFGTAFPATAVVPANPYNDRLLKMDQVSRNAVFRRTIRESGLACKRVVTSRFQQPYRNLMMWVADCDPPRGIAIYVGPDGSTQARYCGHSEQLRLPACSQPPRRR
jgi:hypothetical protein